MCLLFEDVNLGRKMELMHTILKSRLIACLHTAPAAAESFMLKGRFKLASLAFICFLSLSGCGNRMKDTDEKIPAAPQNNANKLETETTGMDIYEVIPQDIEIDKFLNICLGGSVTVDMLEETAEAEQFHAQINGTEYTGHMAKNNISLIAVNPTSYDAKVLSEDEIRKKCDEIVQKLSWGSAKVKKCTLENDERGSYYLLVYEFDVAGFPIIGNLGFAIPNTGGEDFTSGEYITIQYGTQLRSVEASNIRRILDVSDTVEIISEAEAEEAINTYFSSLEETGIKVSQTKQSMQLVYIPYPTAETYENLIPAWMMNSVTDNGEQYFTVINAETGYVYMNGL